MPVTKLQFRPGVNRESTSLSNEGGWYDCNNIRFRSGYPEKLGGWTVDTGTQYASQTGVITQTVASNGVPTNLASSVLLPTTTSGYKAASFWGVCRNLWAWLNLSGSNFLGLGTHLKYYVQPGSNSYFYDVTPIRLVTTNTAVFSLTAGSSTIVVTDAANGVQANDFVTFSGATSTDATITAAILNAEFQVTSVSGTGYTVKASVNATTTALQGGGAVSAYYQLTTGSSTSTQNYGWGAGGYGGFNTGATSTTVSSALSATATTISVTSNAGFPTSGTLVLTNAVGTNPTSNLTYLFSSLSSGASTVVGNNLTGFPTAGTALIFNMVSGSLVYAYFTYTGISTNTFTGVTWGVNGTSATAFSVGATIGVYTDVGEIVTYTGLGTNTFTGVTRAANGTNAGTHSVNALVYNSTVTGASSYSSWGSVSNAATYIGQQLRLWSAANYGQDLIINPSGGAMYYWANASNPTQFNRAQILQATASASPGATTYPVYTSSGSFTPDYTCPSQVNLVLVSNSSNFVIAFGCNDPSGVVSSTSIDPQLVRWSDQQAVQTWLPTPTNQAGSYRLSQGSQIITAIPAQQGILILTDNSAYIMQYVGAPYVWGFNVMASDISIMGANAAANVNNVVYWMGVNKFYSYNGTVQTVPCAVRQYVFDNINLTQSAQVYAGTNEAYNEVWWFYPSVTGRNPDGSFSSGTPSNPNTVTDSYVVYNYVDQTWYYGAMQSGSTTGRTAWLYAPQRGTPMSTDYYGHLIYQESLNSVDDGTTSPQSTAIPAFVQSADFDIGDGNNFGFVWRLIPDVNFTGSNTFSTPSIQPSVNISLLPRQNPGNAYGISNNPTVTAAENYVNQREYVVQTYPSTSQVYIRVRGRQMALKVQSTGLGVAWQSGTHRLDIRPDGRR